MERVPRRTQGLVVFAVAVALALLLALLWWSVVGDDPPVVEAPGVTAVPTVGP